MASSAPPPRSTASAPSPREGAADAYARELAETLGSLSPQQRRALDELAELDRAEGEPAETRVIPSVEAVLRGWTFVARRIGVEPVANVRAVEAAIEHARSLSLAPADDPAALFYAFACRPRAFVGGARVMPALIAINEARRLGNDLTFDARELDDLRRRLLAADRPSFDEVRAWFTVHLAPRA